MLKRDELFKAFEQSNYWDELIIHLECSNNADVVHIVLDSGIEYTFHKCYKVDFLHDISYPKGLKNEYYLQNVELEIINQYYKEFYKTILSGWPMKLIIISEDITIAINKHKD